MMKVATYDQEGKEVGQTLLPKEIFGLEVNQELIHQVVVSQTANRRQVSAHTKGRGQVSGGGKKPWRQKGTGRARHGSTRSPIWRHGGIAFGPSRDRNFKKKINRKMKRLALLMVLSAKAKGNFLLVLETLKLEKIKTKFIAQLLQKLPCKNESALIVLPGMDKNVILASRNLKNAKPSQVKDLNALDLLTFKYLVMPKESIKVLKETMVKD
ncbi:MAG: 50S ribosomal protein L4 [Candidatus Nealsonbacteria bacterium RIFCSPHIGHO2_01_FULL_43_31]|uniref:Large ribosomal subunit protein uL4 n=1 Tax=Candidatus Nealsonbacteria bacterium RIFCSPHIGHO2_01_FULL_43_31 TaxID=1801665 RepID=A0A1G2E235_9BACT|nr:MAG: 50S ribosomal protein L4 [Candidatus Nealsonbacteria bacterium RIFCSPHIGHO2_01_FULL_43_31]OGZ24548.1 MAG: 50S ribosomal protein L4 [Candidatus Nealsonbacteria bacterium RIFCSPLOWO2_01_FULL_43_36]